MFQDHILLWRQQCRDGLILGAGKWNGIHDSAVSFAASIKCLTIII